MNTDIHTPVRLQGMGTLLVSGPDARSFLQGQLSADLDALTADRMLLASCNSSQGRVQAVTWIILRSDAIVLTLPASMLEATLARLRKYVLRAKVQLQIGGDQLVAYATQPASGLTLSAREHRQIESNSYIRWPGKQERILLLAPALDSARADAKVEQAWHLEDIRAGLPQVYPATHEKFVAQMLNLDVLEGIGFEKGCYTGQEIIARTHFRGAIKRRMFLFRSDAPAPEPGTRVLQQGEHAGEVVDAADTNAGSELLAVIGLAYKDLALELDHSSRSLLHKLDLPYAVMKEADGD